MAIARRERQDGRVEETTPPPVRVAARATWWFAALWVAAVLAATAAVTVMDRNTDDVVMGLLVGLALLGSTALGLLVLAHVVWLLVLRDAVDPLALPRRRRTAGVVGVVVGTLVGVAGWWSSLAVPLAVVLTVVVAVAIPGLVGWWLVAAAVHAGVLRTDP